MTKTEIHNIFNSSEKVMTYQEWILHRLADKTGKIQAKEQKKGSER